MGKDKEALPKAEEAVELFRKSNPARLQWSKKVLNYIKSNL